MEKVQDKMTIEIWSDVMCPFCYIGKRRFETALMQFAAKNNIELIWKSFQLSPDLQTDTSTNIHAYLAKHKGISLQEAEKMNNYVTEMAEGEGLVYHFDKAVVANSFNAHRFTHFAKKFGKQNEAEEKLFNAYFTDGKNIDDYSTLINLGIEIGLDAEELKKSFENGDYANDVRTDIYEAQQVGVRGVPFFVFDRKFAVSGAQASSTFLQALEQSFTEWRTENEAVRLKVSEGQTCSPDEDCK